MINRVVVKSQKKSDRDTKWGYQAEAADEDFFTCEVCWESLELVNGHMLRCPDPACEARQ